MLSESEADETAAVAAAVADVAGLSWPECSEERLLKLLKLLGEAVFLPGLCVCWVRVGLGFGTKPEPKT